MHSSNLVQHRTLEKRYAACLTATYLPCVSQEQLKGNHDLTLGGITQARAKSHALEVACMPHLLQYFFPLLLLHTFYRVIDDCILLAALVHSGMLAGTQHLENAEHIKH